MRLDTKNPYRVIFWIAVATIFASLSVAVLVGQFGRRTTDPFFTDNPTRRLSDADVAAIAIKFDDAKSNNHGRLRLGLHNDVMVLDDHIRSEEHTSELQSLMRNSYAVFCLTQNTTPHHTLIHSIHIIIT